MPLWLIILGGLTGGFLVVHGFGKAKEGTEQALDVYEATLKSVSEQQSEDEDDEDEKESE